MTEHLCCARRRPTEPSQGKVYDPVPPVPTPRRLSDWVARVRRVHPHPGPMSGPPFLTDHGGLWSVTQTPTHYHETPQVLPSGPSKLRRPHPVRKGGGEELGSGSNPPPWSGLDEGGGL